MSNHDVSQAHACRLVSADPNTLHRKKTPDNPVVRQRMREIPHQPNERRSLDFLNDVFDDGRRYRNLAVIDDCTRESLALVADTSLSAHGSTESLTD